MAVLGVLVTLGFSSLRRAREQADDTVAKAYLREVSQGVESKRFGNAFALPPLQNCASLAGKAEDPQGVTSCTYQPLHRDAYIVAVSSETGSTFQYDGYEINELK